MDTQATSKPPSEPVSSNAARKAKPAVTDKIAALEAQLAAARAEAREAAKARATIVGAAVIDAMKTDVEFARAVAAHLKTKVKGARDKANIADLLL
jgi:hypothetical protein